MVIQIRSFASYSKFIRFESKSDFTSVKKSISIRVHVGIYILDTYTLYYSVTLVRRPCNHSQIGCYEVSIKHVEIRINEIMIALYVSYREALHFRSDH